MAYDATGGRRTPHEAASGLLSPVPGVPCPLAVPGDDDATDATEHGPTGTLHATDGPQDAVPTALRPTGAPHGVPVTTGSPTAYAGHGHATRHAVGPQEPIRAVVDASGMPYHGHAVVDAAGAVLWHGGPL